MWSRWRWAGLGRGGAGCVKVVWGAQGVRRGAQGRRGAQEEGSKRKDPGRTLEEEEEGLGSKEGEGPGPRKRDPVQTCTQKAAAPEPPVAPSSASRYRWLLLAPVAPSSASRYRWPVQLQQHWRQRRSRYICIAITVLLCSCISW